MSLTVAEYRALAKPKRSHPEQSLQEAVVKALGSLETAGLLYVYDWTASLAGAHRRTPGERSRAIRSGLRPGWPDLQFACWDGVTRYIELKAPGGRLSCEQRLFSHYAEPLGIWAKATSVGEVIRALTCWGCIRKEAA